MSHTLVDFLLKQREYTWEKESWFTPVLLALKHVSSKEASWQPDHGGNTIWQIVHHMNYYNQLILSRIEAKEGTFNLTNRETFQSPGDPDDQEGWQETLNLALKIHQELTEALSQLSEEKLQQSKLSDNLVVWSQHDAYHVGQMVLLLRIQGKWPPVQNS